MNINFIIKKNLNYKPPELLSFYVIENGRPALN